MPAFFSVLVYVVWFTYEVSGNRPSIGLLAQPGKASALFFYGIFFFFFFLFSMFFFARLCRIAAGRASINLGVVRACVWRQRRRVASNFPCCSFVVARLLAHVTEARLMWPRAMAHHHVLTLFYVSMSWHLCSLLSIGCNDCFFEIGHANSVCFFIALHLVLNQVWLFSYLCDLKFVSCLFEPHVHGLSLSLAGPSILTTIICHSQEKI